MHYDLHGRPNHAPIDLPLGYSPGPTKSGDFPAAHAALIIIPPGSGIDFARGFDCWFQNGDSHDQVAVGVPRSLFMSSGLGIRTAVFRPARNRRPGCAVRSSQRSGSCSPSSAQVEAPWRCHRRGPHPSRCPGERRRRQANHGFGAIGLQVARQQPAAQNSLLPFF